MRRSFLSFGRRIEGTRNGGPGASDEPLDESLEHIVKQFLARVPFQVKVDDFYAPGGAFKNLNFELSGEGFDDAYSAVLETFSFATLERRFEGAFGFGVHGRIRFFCSRSVIRSGLSGRTSVTTRSSASPRSVPRLQPRRRLRRNPRRGFAQRSIGRES